MASKDKGTDTKVPAAQRKPENTRKSEDARKRESSVASSSAPAVPSYYTNYEAWYSRFALGRMEEEGEKIDTNWLRAEPDKEKHFSGEHRRHKLSLADVVVKTYENHAREIGKLSLTEIIVLRGLLKSRYNIHEADSSQNNMSTDRPADLKLIKHYRIAKGKEVNKDGLTLAALPESERQHLRAGRHFLHTFRPALEKISPKLTQRLVDVYNILPEGELALSDPDRFTISDAELQRWIDYASTKEGRPKIPTTKRTTRAAIANHSDEDDY